MLHHAVLGGCGAVGAPFAYFLSRSGARVSLVLRPERANKLRNNPKIRLFNLNVRSFHVLTRLLLIFIMIFFVSFSFISLFPCLLFSLCFSPLFYLFISRFLPPCYVSPLVWSNFTIFSDCSDLSSSDPPIDYFWLPISSVELRAEQGKVIKQLLNKLQNKAIVVLLSPHPDDRNYMLSIFPYPERLVTGSIGIAAYQLPLKDESWSPVDNQLLTDEVNIAYFIAPGQYSQFYGPFIPSSVVSSALTAGGGLARVTKETPVKQLILPIALLHPILLGLQCEKWKWKNFFNNHQLINLSLEAAKESIPIALHQFHLNIPSFLLKLLNIFLSFPVFLRFVFFFLQLIGPFDVEKMVAFHFDKVKDQTKLIIQSFIDRGKSTNSPVGQLEKLLMTTIEREKKQ
jgi:hypothetical protein